MATPGTKWQRSIAFTFGLLAPLLALFIIYVIVEMWSVVTSTGTAALNTVLFGFITWKLTPQESLLVLSALGGLLGGLVYSMARYPRARSRESFRAQDASFYWTRTVIAGVLGLAVYALIRGGLLVLGSSSDDAPNAYAILGITVIAGLSTDRVLARLRKFAGDFFSTEDDEDDVVHSAIKEWTPNELKRGVADQLVTLTLTTVPPAESVFRVAGAAATPLPDQGDASHPVFKLDAAMVTDVEEVEISLDPGAGARSVVSIPVVMPAG